MIPHPRDKTLLALIQSLTAKAGLSSWTGTAYRYVSTEYSSANRILSGDGAFRAGGRWNHPGEFHAVYCASSAELAHREYFHATMIAGFPAATAMPLTGKALGVHLTGMLDLLDPAVLKRLRLHRTAILADPWRFLTDTGKESLCQAVGRAARMSGCQALRVPSTCAITPDEFTLVLIRENLPPDGKAVRVLRRGGR